MKLSTARGLDKRSTRDRVNVKNQSNKTHQSELYEGEKKQVFMYLNNLITKLAVETDRLKFSGLNSQSNVNEHGDQMKTVQDIINQLKKLIKMESSRLIMMINKVVNNYTTKDRQKLRELKIELNWLMNSLYLAIVRFNEIRSFLNLPPSDNLYTVAKKQAIPFQLSFISKKKKREIELEERFKETELILTDLRTPVELLKTRIVDYGITPTYRLLKRNTSGQQLVYSYSCSLFGLYVEGNGTSKYEARENTAAEMLRLILKKQKTISLSSHIRGFNEHEMKTINPLIKAKANYVDVLEKACAKYMYPPPTYTLLSHVQNYSTFDDHFSIQCNAMDFVAIGHSNKKSTAKQISAQNILILSEKLYSKRIAQDAA